MSRDAELKIISFDGITIDSERGIAVFTPLPTYLTLLTDITMSNPYGVCHYKGSTYVGLNDNTIARIDSNYKLYESFINCSGSVDSVVIYKDLVYMLLYTGSQYRTVKVCDMSGKEITQWGHFCFTYPSNVLTIVSDQVVIADPPNKRITVYSLDGQILRQVPCSLLSNYYGFMCAVDDCSVVYSDHNSSKVFRVNINTGDVMWTCSDIKEPQGITVYGRGYVLVARNNCSSVKVLDIKTGKYQNIYILSVIKIILRAIGL